MFNKSESSTETPENTPKVKKDRTFEKQIVKIIVTRVVIAVAVNYAAEAVIKAIDNKVKTRKNETPQQ